MSCISSTFTAANRHPKQSFTSSSFLTHLLFPILANSSWCHGFTAALMLFPLHMVSFSLLEESKMKTEQRWLMTSDWDRQELNTQQGRWELKVRGRSIDSLSIEYRCTEESGRSKDWEKLWRLRFTIVLLWMKYEEKGLTPSFLPTATTMLQTPTFPLSALAVNLPPEISSPGNGNCWATAILLSQLPAALDDCLFYIIPKAVIKQIWQKHLILGVCSPMNQQIYTNRISRMCATPCNVRISGFWYYF